MLSKVADYTIIHGPTTGALITNVKKSMEDGWVPSGPLLLDNKDYLQVMVKFEA